MPPSRISIRRPLGDRIANAAGCAWIAGLVAWYAGAYAAIDRTLDGMSLFIPVALLSLVGGVAALLMERRRDRVAFGTAAVLAAGLALFGFGVAALINRYADGSAAYQQHATVLSFQDPTKGPPTVSVGLDGKRYSFEATHAEGCSVGSRASVELRPGALGARWLQTIRCEAPPLANGLRFIEDDYVRARADAIRRGVPLFVDVWASWCHTCMSLKQFVLPDAALAPLANAFVWLAIDSERASNRAFLERFATRSLPTLWVIDPASEVPRLKWIGAATSQELASVLADARQADAGSAQAGDEVAEADTLWLRGNRASAAGQAEQAVDHYRRALAAAPADWGRRPRALEALAMRLAELDRHAESVKLAVEETARMQPGTSRLNVLLLGIDAAGELPESDPARAGALPAMIALAERIAADATEPVLLDDRSSLYASLVALLGTRDPDRSRKLAADWAALLDAQAAREATPAARRVWDAHRVEAYLALGEPARAIPMLEQSEREQPDDFNPPARLARAYLKLQQLPEARAAIDRALQRCDGPRKLRLYLLKADILLAAGDRQAARNALEEALAFARGANLPSQYERLRQTVERRARELS